MEPFCPSLTLKMRGNRANLLLKRFNAYRAWFIVYCVYTMPNGCFKATISTFIFIYRHYFFFSSIILILEFNSIHLSLIFNSLLFNSLYLTSCNKQHKLFKYSYSSLPVLALCLKFFFFYVVLCVFWYLISKPPAK
jgi:hypothetical protein